MPHAEEILRIVLPAGNEATEVVAPGEEPFDLPSAAGARGPFIRPIISRRRQGLFRGADAGCSPHFDAVRNHPVMPSANRLNFSSVTAFAAPPSGKD